jgi:hypothetical protein
MKEETAMSSSPVDVYSNAHGDTVISRESNILGQKFLGRKTLC